MQHPLPYGAEENLFQQRPAMGSHSNQPHVFLLGHPHDLPRRNADLHSSSHSKAAFFQPLAVLCKGPLGVRPQLTDDVEAGSPLDGTERLVNHMQEQHITHASAPQSV